MNTEGETEEAGSDFSAPAQIRKQERVFSLSFFYFQGLTAWAVVV